MMQGGDFAMQNGSGGESIWGKKFKDEKDGLKLKHDARGVLSMVGRRAAGERPDQERFLWKAVPPYQLTYFGDGCILKSDLNISTLTSYCTVFAHYVTGNTGKNSNGSQFFITFGPCKALDGKHVVFGKVVDGWNVLDKIEAVAVSSGGVSEAGVVKVSVLLVHPMKSVCKLPCTAFSKANKPPAPSLVLFMTRDVMIMFKMWMGATGESI